MLTSRLPFARIKVEAEMASHSRGSAMLFLGSYFLLELREARATSSAAGFYRCATLAASIPVPDQSPSAFCVASSLYNELADLPVGVLF